MTKNELGDPNFILSSFDTHVKMQFFAKFKQLLGEGSEPP